MSGTIVEFDETIEDDGSTRIVFRVQNDDGTLPDKRMRKLGLRRDDPAFDALAQMHSDPDIETTSITDAGTALIEALRRHDNAAIALDQTLNAPPTAPKRDIRLVFRDFGQDARNFPWEVMHDPNSGFLGMDLGIPILRVVKTAPNATRPLQRLSGGELRLVAVLAAEGVDSHPDYDAMMRALQRYGRPWRLRIFTPDVSVKQAVEAAGDDRIELLPVPETAQDLMSDIAAFRPQICHFFCHGLSTSGGRLLVANALTLMGGGPLVIKPSELGRQLPSSTWLVTLNACSSNRPDSDSESVSLATGLVRNGVPVVVGMRQETGATTLNTLTKTFLGDALEYLETALGGNAPIELDLSVCLNTARNAICGSVPPRRIKEWSLPTMTVCAEGFQIEPGSPTGTPGGEDADLLLAALIGERNMLRQFLEQVGDSLNDDRRRKIEARLAILDAASNQIMGVDT